MHIIGLTADEWYEGGWYRQVEQLLGRTESGDVFTDVLSWRSMRAPGSLDPRRVPWSMRTGPAQPDDYSPALDR